jgi:hypothetical protein
MRLGVSKFSSTLGSEVGKDPVLDSDISFNVGSALSADGREVLPLGYGAESTIGSVENLEKSTLTRVLGRFRDN